MTENDLFKKNCERWALFNPEAAKKLGTLTCRRVVVTKNADGSANLKTTIRGTPDFYHSEQNPALEASQCFSGAKLLGIKVIFVYGVGLGYMYDAAKAWLKESKEHILVFLEDDLEVLSHLFHTERGYNMLHDSQVRLILIDRTIESFRQLGITFALKPFTILALDLYAKTRIASFEQVKTNLAFFLNPNMSVAMEYGDHGKIFFTNYFRNLLELPESALANTLFGQFTNCPAIICGAGPSLAKNLGLLATLRDKALIFASGSAMNAINLAGLQPHFGAAIDPNHAQYTRLIMNEAFDTPYFYRNRVFTDALKLIHGKHLYVTGTTGYPISEWFEERLGITEQQTIDEGCSVMNFTLSLAHLMGCNPIILVGTDLAYTHGQSYAPGIHNHPIHLRKEYLSTKTANEEVVTRADIYGEPTLSLWKWVAESSYVSYFCANNDTNIINATEGGIGFYSVANTPLIDVATALLQKQYDFDGMIQDCLEKARLPNDATYSAIKESMQVFLQSVIRSEELCRALQTEYETQAGKKLFEELEKEPCYTHLLKVFGQKYLEFHAHNLEVLKHEAHELEEAEVKKRKAAFHRGSYTFLQQTAKVTKDIIENVLKEEPHRQNKSQAVSSGYSAVKNETYSYENGLLIIEDPELGIHIKEAFVPDETTDIQQKFYPTGQLAAMQYYFNGVLHGPSTFFNEAGKVTSRHWFIQGRREGKALVFTYVNSIEGTVISKASYKNGLLHGTQESFYDTGRPKAVIPYQTGTIHGEVTLYYPDGTLKRQLSFVAGKRQGLERLWNEHGVLTIEAEFNQDMPTGTARQWYDNGKMALEVIYEQDPSKYTVREWDEEGVLLLTEQKEPDYYGKIALQTSKLTETLSQMVAQVNTMGPLLDKMIAAGDAEAPPLEAIKLEMENLKKISQELVNKSGLDPSHHENEPNWNGPAARRQMEHEMQEMITRLAKNMHTIHDALTKTLETYAKKQPMNDE